MRRWLREAEETEPKKPLTLDNVVASVRLDDCMDFAQKIDDMVIDLVWNFLDGNDLFEKLDDEKLKDFVKDNRFEILTRVYRRGR